MHARAYSVWDIKSVNEETRTIEGLATSPEPDRGGHIMVTAGAKFKLPMPLLWQHKQDQPIGEVTEAQVLREGIMIRASIKKIDEPGPLKTRLDEAWQSIKHKLVRGFSIGWTPLESPEVIKGTDGDLLFKFGSWEWLETSCVTIPMNAATTISIKSIAAADRAASGTSDPPAPARPTAGGSALPVVKAIGLP
jgi:HK97 family phage prohead protease